MRLFKKQWKALSLAVIAMFGSTTVVSAATLRTASLPGDALGPGSAACYVTNAGPSAGSVSAILYDMNGTALESLGGTVPLAAHATVATPYHSYAVDSPAHCECVVPNTNFRCSVVWFDKDSPSPLFSVIGTQ